MNFKGSLFNETNVGEELKKETMNLKETKSVLWAVKTETGAQEKNYFFISFVEFPESLAMAVIYTGFAFVKTPPNM